MFSSSETTRVLIAEEFEDDGEDFLHEVELQLGEDDDEVVTEELSELTLSS
jgi:hypothetical protein